MEDEISTCDMKKKDWFKPKQEMQHPEEKTFTETAVGTNEEFKEETATVDMAPTMKKRRTVPYAVNGSGTRRFFSSPPGQQVQGHQPPHHKTPKNPLHDFYHQNLKDIKREHDQLLMQYN